MHSTKSYFGIATPQANPTVEIEFQRFMRGPAHAFFTRLTSESEDPSKRLVDYLEQLPSAARSFDRLALSAFGFACTGSAYLVGQQREEDYTEALIQQLRIPVVTATQAIRRELQGHGAERLAILAPYPQTLCDRATEYWQELGFEVVALERIDTGNDTRAIYDLTENQVDDAIRSFDTKDADVLLLSGTGMPTLSALLNHDGCILSSNLCLATELMRRAQCWPATQAANIRTLCGLT